ncbi:MAG: 2-oxoacid:acceptor oxidoreductase subunit alpha [Thermodesulfobacteriota bacterium]|nr:2-oxoacid:acceptor oxidoreductase subunit alpha [Thermodesulfobacteriota bacterium]
MIRDGLNVLIGGEAGQGLLTIGQIFARVLVRSGYFIVVTQSYQSRIRGGHNTFTVRISSKRALSPLESIDILVALDANTVIMQRENLSQKGIIIVDKKFNIVDDVCLHVPYQELTPDRLYNISALGILSAFIGLNENLVGRTLGDFFSNKDTHFIEENRQILTSAFSWVARQRISLKKLPLISNPSHRLMMNGNEAIALGAISAGLKFYSFYPMTPATSIALTLSKQAETMGFIVEQAEDEIAAINMAIGASFAGAQSMVGTSGGGFALMVEGVSLSAMTETPLVIVIAQRPGPATGLPTRTEQADLEFVIHSGHGEFPRAVLAPGTVEDCFYLTRNAFALAEQYQCPIFILTDQFLADSYHAIEPFDIENLSPIQVDTKVDDSISRYHRYLITESGISPRYVPGESEYFVIADSDEHTEDGHLTEDLQVRKKMVEKRLKKEKGIRTEVIPPRFNGDKRPDTLLVSWGSSMGAVLEAAIQMRNNGKRIATLHFSQVWPLVQDQFIGYLKDARQVVCVEGNATGQLAKLIRRETGFHIKICVNRYDGLPINADFILQELNRYNKI